MKKIVGSILDLSTIVRALRDKNRSRANCVPIYGDLYQNLQWSLTFNLKVVTHLKSASEASYAVINMATINRNGSLMYSYSRFKPILLKHNIIYFSHMMVKSRFYVTLIIFFFP